MFFSKPKHKNLLCVVILLLVHLSAHGMESGTPIGAPPEMFPSSPTLVRPEIFSPEPTVVTPEGPLPTTFPALVAPADAPERMFPRGRRLIMPEDGSERLTDELRRKAEIVRDALDGYLPNLRLSLEPDFNFSDEDWKRESNTDQLTNFFKDIPEDRPIPDVITGLLDAISECSCVVFHREYPSRRGLIDANLISLIGALKQNRTLGNEISINFFGSGNLGAEFVFLHALITTLERLKTKQSDTRPLKFNLVFSALEYEPLIESLSPGEPLSYNYEEFLAAKAQLGEDSPGKRELAELWPKIDAERDAELARIDEEQQAHQEFVQQEIDAMKQRREEEKQQELVQARAMIEQNKQIVERELEALREKERQELEAVGTAFDTWKQRLDIQERYRQLLWDEENRLREQHPTEDWRVISDIESKYLYTWKIEYEIRDRLKIDFSALRDNIYEKYGQAMYDQRADEIEQRYGPEPYENPALYSATFFQFLRYFKNMFPRVEITATIYGDIFDYIEDCKQDPSKKSHVLRDQDAPLEKDFTLPMLEHTLQPPGVYGLANSFPYTADDTEEIITDREYLDALAARSIYSNIKYLEDVEEITTEAAVAIVPEVTTDEPPEKTAIEIDDDTPGPNRYKFYSIVGMAVD